MKYFSMFSGIGGFEKGIEDAYKCISNQQSTKIEQDRQGGNRTSDEVEHDVLSTSRTTPLCNDTERKSNGIRQSEAESEDSSNSKSGTSQLPRRPLCIGFSEIDKYAKQIYEKHFKGHKDYENCRNICWEQLPDFDLLVGGFPCQSFSIAGKRGGFLDTRGTLFFEIARAIREKQPRIVVLENVKGLLSHDKGSTFATILSTLDELGYDCQWQVLNSKNFGVPQNRERVFIIGHLRGTSRPEVFPLTGTNGKDKSTFIDEAQWRREGKLRIYDGICSTLNTAQGGGHTPLTTKPKIRRLTPTECERLQGFPDGWTEGISDTQRYKCLGNAVTTNVITAIFERILS